MMSQLKKLIFLVIALVLVGGFLRPILAYYHEQTGQTQTEEQRRATLRSLEAQKQRLEAELEAQRRQRGITPETEVMQGREDTILRPRTRLEQKYYLELQKVAPTFSTTVRDEYERKRELLKSRLSDSATDYPSLTSEERAKRIRAILEEKKDETATNRGEIKKKWEELSLEKEIELRLNQEELKKRSKEVLSERKAQIAEKLSKQINFINDKITDKYLRHLEKWSDVLDKMESRANKLASEGFDTFDIKLKIAAARDAILKANEQILIQKAKIYTVKIDDETSVGKVFSQVRRELGDDHQRLKKEIMAPIREILKEVRQSFKGLVKITTEEKIESE